MRRRKLDGFTLAEHQRAGKALVGIQHELNGLFTKISGSYPKSSKAVRSAGLAVRAVQRLRLGLRDAVESEQGDREDLGDIYQMTGSEKVG